MKNNEYLETYKACGEWEDSITEFENFVRPISKWFNDDISLVSELSFVIKNRNSILDEAIYSLPKNSYPPFISKGPVDDERFHADLERLLFDKNHVNRSDDIPPTPKAAWLIARSLINYCKQNHYSASHISISWQIAKNDFFMLFCFGSQLQRCLNDGNERVKNAILEIMDCIQASPEDFVDSYDPQGLTVAIEGMNKANSFNVLWHTGRYCETQFHFPFLGLLELLREKHLKEYFEALEAFKWPDTLSLAFLHLPEENNFEEYLRLLKHAPCAFENNTWNKKISAGCLLNNVFYETHKNLHLQHANISPDKVIRAIQEISDIVMARQDAVPIISFWLIELIWRGQRGSRNQRHDFDPHNEAIDIFSKALASHEKIKNNLLLPYEILQEVEEKDTFLKAAKLQSLLILLLVSEELGNAGKFSETLKGLYIEALQQNEIGVRYSEDFSSTKWEEHYLSKVFWDSKNPAKEWLDIWNAPDLLAKRRRRSFYSYTKEDRQGYAEFTHSYVGVALLDYLFSKDEPDIEQACLLFENILVNVLNEPGLLSFDGLPLFLSNLFARLPHIFKAQEMNESETLRGYFSWLGGDHQLISLCTYGMHRNGYDITQIENWGSIFSGKSLKQIIATYIEWEEREGGKPNRYDWPSNCRSMFNDVFQSTA